MPKREKAETPNKFEVKKLVVVLVLGGLMIAATQTGLLSEVSNRFAKGWVGLTVEDTLTGQTASGSAARLRFVPAVRKKFADVTANATDEQLIQFAVAACDVEDRGAGGERSVALATAGGILTAASPVQSKQIERLALKSACPDY